MQTSGRNQLAINSNNLCSKLEIDFVSMLGCSIGATIGCNTKILYRIL